jgi:hypothetical protein
MNVVPTAAWNFRVNGLDFMVADLATLANHYQL